MRRPTATRWRSRPAALAVVLASWLATACSAGGADADPAADERRFPGPAVWQVAGEPFGPPHAAGDVVVGLEKSGDRLFTVALDARTGTRLWRKEASPGDAPPGWPVDLSVVADAAGKPRVVYLRPEGDDLMARVVVAEARTGQDLGVSVPLDVASRPQACEHGPDVCFAAQRIAFGGLSERRLRLSDFTLVDEQNGFSDALPIGPHGLHHVRTSAGEYLTAPSSTGGSWVQSIDSVFGRGRSLDRGVRFSYYPDRNLFVGTIGGTQTDTPGPPPTATVDLTTYGTAALDAATGKPRWTDRGSMWQCFGAAFLSTHFPEPSGAGDPGWPVRCRTVGTLTVAEGQEPRFSGFGQTVEGVDLATGRTTWSVPLGKPRAAADPPQTRFVVQDRRHLGFVVPDGLVLVDLADGRTRRASPADRLGCLTDPVIQYAWPVAPEDWQTRDRVGEPVMRFCNGSGDEIDQPPPIGVLRYLGATAAGVTVVAHLDGWAAYR